MALGYVRTDLAAPGSKVEVEIFGRRVPATAVPSRSTIPRTPGCGPRARPCEVAPPQASGHRPVYARSAALVVLAGVLWSMGGAGAGRGRRSVQIVLYRSLFVIPVAAGFIAFRGADLSAALCARLERAVRRVRLAAFVTFVTALTLTTVANAAFVLATTPFAAALLGRLVLGEPVRARPGWRWRWRPRASP